MSIQFSCDCGKRYKLDDTLAGKKAKCKACGATLTVPMPEYEPDDSAAYDLAEEPVAPKPAPPRPAPAPTPTRSTSAARTPAFASKSLPKAAKPVMLADIENAKGSMFRRYAYLLLLLTLIPLAWSTFLPGKFDLEKEIDETVTHHPEVAEKLTAALGDEEDERHARSAAETERAFFNALPDHKLDSALFSHETWAHWGLAGLSSAAFIGVVLALFPGAHRRLKTLLLVGLFTGTVGIFLLLAFQYIADATQGVFIRGGGWLTLLFYIVKFIGWSYRAALDADANFFVSAFGFTFGVGLCEEICKSAPVLLHYQTRHPDGDDEWSWRVALIVGLISGVGFGVSEGISYSSDYYNGLMGPGIYGVRFISCVGLHAVWSGAAAIMIYRHRDALQGAEGFFGTLLVWVVLVLVPMIFHGFYDTLLKKDHEAMALGVAVLSFVWLAFMIERVRKANGDLDELTPVLAR
ncbi:MAG: PrsW family glutamic-type intramembrane protease [Tepidisphaeraceae bacterium]